jgi:3-phenylpropionate/trans-cinnamate dioxygenase ferredoxin subunit
MVSVSVDDTEILVFLHPDGTVSAIEDRCSHADVRLSDGDFDAEAGTVTCIAHGAKFCSRKGTQLCMPAVSPVEAYHVRLEGDNVMLVEG